MIRAIVKSCLHLLGKSRHRRDYYPCEVEQKVQKKITIMRRMRTLATIRSNVINVGSVETLKGTRLAASLAAEHSSFRKYPKEISNHFMQAGMAPLALMTSDIAASC